MINFGHIYKDQSGQIMDRGENTYFLILGYNEANEDNGSPAKAVRYQVLEIGDENKPMGPITFEDSEKLEKLKYVCNLPKVIWDI